MAWDLPGPEVELGVLCTGRFYHRASRGALNRILKNETRI